MNRDPTIMADLQALRKIKAETQQILHQLEIQMTLANRTVGTLNAVLRRIENLDDAEPGPSRRRIAK